MNDRRKFNKYIVFWLTQSLSELGSSMTSFALVIRAYGQTCSALSVSLGILVPEEYRSRASGMSSFSSNLITVVTPMLAAALFSFGGLKGILFIDLLTFLLGAGILFFFISIPEASLKEQIGEKQGPFTGFLWGWRFLKAHKGILYIILSMSMLNFFSRLTYENILSPMILARSQSSSVLGIVTGILGALFASVPIPFILAAQNVMIYHRIPAEIQGRIFAVRNALQFGTIPVGILLGGFLADYVFEPFMESNIPLALFLTGVTGEAPGKGMAVMFLCTGILGFSSSIFWMRIRHIREISRTD